MTNSEWLNMLVPEVPEGIKTAIMESRGVTPSGTYSNGQAIDLALADLYMRMLVMPEFKEGSLSVKYDKSSLKSAANEIYLQYNDPRYDDGQPVIKGFKL